MMESLSLELLTVHLATTLELALGEPLLAKELG